MLKNLIYNFINKFKLYIYGYYLLRFSYYKYLDIDLMALLCFCVIRLIQQTTHDLKNLLQYDFWISDLGTINSLILSLEHLFVCYWLIIILVVVYWSLYIIVMDYIGYNLIKINSNLLFSFIFNLIIEKFLKNFYILYFNFYKLFLKISLILKDLEFIYFLIYANVDFGADSSIPSNFWDLFFYLFRKTFLNNKNFYIIFSIFFKYHDFFGRPFLLINYGTLKFLLRIAVSVEFFALMQKKINYTLFIKKRRIESFLFYNMADAYYYSSIESAEYFAKQGTFSFWTALRYSHVDAFFLRSLLKDRFDVNNFKHSGIFEAIWASGPTLIIISILIPSLILLYSFEDILNPSLTVKVIGNQWYWSYEYNNFVLIENNSNDLDLNNKTLINYAYDSKIIDTAYLDFGTKRLLEVDNRLVLPTNIPIRFLVSSADVLHSFAMPDLGFKIDATPGRLNQILVSINRPGVYYGQCSELCGANHGFMPIVIQAIPYNNYLNFLNNILL